MEDSSVIVCINTGIISDMGREHIGTVAFDLKFSKVTDWGYGVDVIHGQIFRLLNEAVFYCYECMYSITSKQVLQSVLGSLKPHT